MKEYQIGDVVVVKAYDDQSCFIATIDDVRSQTPSLNIYGITGHSIYRWTAHETIVALVSDLNELEKAMLGVKQ